jgi:hypothetical protein
MRRAINASMTGGVNLSMLFPNATSPQLRFRATLGEVPEIEVTLD